MSSFSTALVALWPHGNLRIPNLREAIITQSDSLFKKYELADTNLIAHFMAQVSEECNAGIEVEENLNYTAARLMAVWPSRFPTMIAASQYAHSPQRLANHVYNGRMGNAVGSNDGWLYRGRGGTQTTGKDSYAALMKKLPTLDLITHPELVNDPAHFLECSLVDFIACGCLPYAKKNDIIGVSAMLNVGHLVPAQDIEGLSNRMAWLKRWNTALTEDTPVS
jgi:putative chitinase